MKEYALIVAGGTGSRMESSLPKQFLEIGGLPIVMHTIKAFYTYSPDIEIILVLPKNQLHLWSELRNKYGFDYDLQLQPGGTTRFESVQNGLSKISDEGLVAIHDGVRPFISTEIIASCFAMAAKNGSAITSVESKDSVRAVEGTSNKALDRSQLRLIQTPQTFRVSLIKSAYDSAPHTNFTDDASVLERAGGEIHLVKGSYRNFKITTPYDVKVAEFLART